MEIKDRLFMLQSLVTIGAIICAAGLFPGSVIGYKIEIAVLLFGGLWFSWFRLNRANAWLRFAAPGAMAVICIWMMYKIFGASLEYGDILVVLIKGLVFSEVVLSYGLCVEGFTGYAQVLSIPLFMAQALFIKEYTPGVWVLIVIYLVLLVVAMRLQFYNPVDAVSADGGSALFFHSRPFAVLIGLLLLSISTGGFLATAVPLTKLSRFDVPFAAFGEGGQNWRDDYYEKMETMQKDLSGVILDLQSRDRRIESLDNLNNLIKDSPLTRDADKGEQGLISLLKSPGAGREDVRLENRRHLDAYGNSKTRFEQNRAQEQVSQDLRDDPLNVPARMSVMNFVSRIRQAKTLDDARNLAGAQEKLKDLSLGKRLKSDVIDQLKRMQEWKLYEIYRADTAYLAQEAQAMSGEKQARLQELIEHIQGLSQMDGIAAVQKEIDEAGDNFKGTDILNKLQEALDIKAYMIRVAQAARAKEEIAKDPFLSEAAKEALIEDIDKRTLVIPKSSAPESFMPLQAGGEISLKSLEIRLPRNTDQQSGFDFTVSNTDTNLYERKYLKGKYRTKVEVFEGKVAVSEYSGQGTQQEGTQMLLPEQSVSREAMVEGASGVNLDVGENTISPTVIGTCKDGSQWDLTQRCKWKTADSNIADVVGGKITAKSAGTTRINAIFGNVESLPLEITIEGANETTAEGPNDQPPIPPPPVNESAPPARSGVLSIAIGTAVIVINVLMVIVAVLLYLTGLRKAILKEKRRRPQEFIIALYENLCGFFGLLGMKIDRTMTYRQVVQHVEKTFLLDDQLFKEITDHYEEARFSAHVISASSVPEITEKYRQLIKNILAQCSASRKIRLFILVLVHRLPLFM